MENQGGKPRWKIGVGNRGGKQGWKSKGDTGVENKAVEINSRVQGGVQSWHKFPTRKHRLMEASSNERIMRG